MPSFKFTSPEGKSYTVDGPAGSTKEQAFGILQTRLAGPTLGPKGVPDQPPAQGNSGQPDKSDSPIFDEASGLIGGLAKGATAATTGMLGRAGATLGGIAGQVAMGDLGTQQGAARTAEGAEEGAQKLTYTRQGPESKILDAAGRALDDSKLAGLGPTEAIGMAGATPRGAARAAISPEVDALKKLPGKAADLVTPKPAPEIAALAKKAEALGIELRPDMLANNKIAKFIGEALEQVPMSGSKAEQRQMAFNGALTKIIGGDDRAKRLTPDVFDRAMTASGEKIGQIAKETPITVTPELRKAFNDRVMEAAKFETSDVARIISNYVQELDGLTVDGVMPGEAFRKLNSKIGAQARRAEGDLKFALHELQEEMHSALEANISSPERLAELQDARYRYAMGKVIEPLVAKAKGGDISPAALMGAVTSDSGKKSMMARGRGGDIGDLARIGQAFLKEPPSSGTGERLGAYGILTGGVIAEPHTAAGIVGAANLYNRLGPKLTKRAVNMRDVDPQASQPWNLGQP